MSRRISCFGVVALTVSALLSGCSAPPATATPTINTRVDYSRLMTNCLADRGFEASGQGTGLVVESVPSQTKDVADAVSDCESLLGYDTVTSLSDEQLGDLYELEEITLECLRGLGYDVTLPSKQVFVDHYYSDEFPLLESQVSEQSSEVEYESAMGECPPATAIYDPYTG